jgi:hypothetical protein
MAVDGSFNVEAAFGSTSYYGITGLEPERALQRVYFSRGNRIVSFDSQSYLKVREITFGNLPTSRSIGRLARWGADGFAAILDNNHLALIRSDIVPSEPGPIDFVVSPTHGAQVSQTPLEIVGKTFGGQGIQSISVNGQPIVSANGYADWRTQVDLSPGTNLLTFRITPFGGGSSVTRNVTITYDAPIARVLEEKARSMLGTANLPSGWESSDQDGDGYSLRDEILLGMNHADSDQPLLVQTLKTTTAGVRTFAYRRLKSLKEDYSLKISTDLNSWSDAHPAVIATGSPVTAPADPDYEDVYFQVDAVQYPRLFFRLLVTRN